MTIKRTVEIDPKHLKEMILEAWWVAAYCEGDKPPSDCLVEPVFIDGELGVRVSWRKRARSLEWALI